VDRAPLSQTPVKVFAVEDRDPLRMKSLIFCGHSGEWNLSSDINLDQTKKVALASDAPSLACTAGWS